MKSSDIFEGISRGLFFVLALFSYIGLAWSGEQRSSIGNFLYIFFIIVLLLLAIKSHKTTNKYMHIALNMTGLVLAVYFILSESIYMYILGVFGFMTLTLIAFNKSNTKIDGIGC